MRRRGRGLVLLAALLVGCSSSTSDGVSGPSPPTSGRPTVSATTTASSTADAVGSSGCEGSAPAAGRSEVELSSGGRRRLYIRYVPPGLEATRPAPVVVDLTAYSPASLQESFSGFTLPDEDGQVKADEVGAVVVMPEPVNGAGLLTWNIDDTDGWTDDVGFLTDVIDDVAGAACTDPGRVLVMGFAIGGVMASTLACAQPDRVAVLATVSGLWDPPGCDPPTPVPTISFHGTDDHFLPFDGGVGDRVGRLGLSPETSAGLVAMANRPGAEASAAAWAVRNGCDPSTDVRASGDAVATTAWVGCDAATELVVIDGGSHTWPGSGGMADYEGLLGPVARSVTANDVIWEFFEAHASR